MSLTTKVAIPAGINAGVSSAKQSTMLNLLGRPRQSFDQHCREVTHPTLKKLIVTANVGPFRVTGLKPAVDSLKEVFDDVKISKPTVFDALGSAGMLCCRNVRGSHTAISNHSWGTAIDLYIDGQLDARGDGKVYQGLVDIYPFFHKHNWFWGAGFRTEDAMHFEASDELIRQWASAGKLSATGAAAITLPDESLNINDRGPEVVKLQEALSSHGFPLKADGKFGINTEETVMAFQEANRLKADGIVGKNTKAKLGI